MLKRVVQLLCACAVALSAQSSFAAQPEPRVIIEKADGTHESIPAVQPGRAGEVIVEFRDPPLALAAGNLAGATPARHQENFARFRNDLAAIFGSSALALGTTRPQIRREYFRAFHGVSARVPRTALAAIERL